MMRNREKNFISAVIYVHNAEKEIGVFLKNVSAVLENNFINSEIICVNDCSTDNSVQEINRVTNEVKNIIVSLIHMSFFQGMEAAMNAGRDLAIGDFVFEFDNPADKFGAQEIMEVYRMALEGYDLVSASSTEEERKSSELFYRVFNHYSEIPSVIGTETFRIISRRLINRVTNMNESVPYRKAVYANCGLKAKSIKFSSIEQSGKRGWRKKDLQYRRTLAIDALILFTEVGYQFSVTMTITMMCIAFAVAIYSIAIYAFSMPVAGWTTTILFLSVAFFGLFGILTVIIKYLQILVNLIFKKKKYCFECIEKLSK